MLIVSSERFADHLTPPGHPESPERNAVLETAAATLKTLGADVVEPVAATREQLLRVHPASHVDAIEATRGKATMIDADTFTSPDTADVALLAAGAAVQAVDAVLDGKATTAAALVRPPGHHAESVRAMGFCFYNNVAVAAAHARARGLSRVAIVDYDVHHGNGTQWSFYDDPSVLFISSHQYPYYPGTGAADEIGTGKGTGLTVNLPLAAGATDADYEKVYEAIAWPILKAFNPELILVSAGFDAYKDDPLAGMRLEPGCFGRLTARIAALADVCCQGRVVVATEGGYHLPGIAESLRAVIDALDTGRSTDGDPVNTGAPRGDATIAAVKPNLVKYWPL